MCAALIFRGQYYVFKNEFSAGITSEAVKKLKNRGLRYALLQMSLIEFPFALFFSIGSFNGWLLPRFSIKKAEGKETEVSCCVFKI